MKEVLVFPEYKAKQDTEKARRTASEKLREDLEIIGNDIKKEHRIYISLPKDGDHQEMHLIGQITGFMNPLNKDVRDKLYEMVGHGVTSVSEMRRHLKVYVDTQMFPKANKPSLTDAAYYPSDATIRKHIYLAQLRLRYSKIDQENLMKLVSQWQESYPKDNFDFLPATSNQDQELDEDNINNVQCVEQDDEDEVFSQLITSTNFFFCHQSEFQRHLLYRYGNALCLLDATYRTTKYALPLFFLAVKTNVGFSVVAEFVVQNETKDLIVQGLQTVQNWVNTAPDKPEGWEWKPKFFMTDFCEREIVAIEETFSDSFVFLCDFHREQSWTRWVSKTDNGVVGSKEKVLSMLRRCAHSCSEEQFENALASLTNSVEWTGNARFRNWFNKTWLSEKKRWVWAYRYGKGLLVNTNNGLERQNKIFKYKFLEQRKDNHLSGMISSLITEYLPAMMLKYTRDNVLASERVGRSYIAEIPDFLKNRPASFIKHCMTKIDLAETVEETDIMQMSANCFKIKSLSDSRKKVEYDVLLDNGHGMPSCGCHAWTWTLLPCKHIFAVINGRFPDVSWKNIPLSYSNSPFFTLDFDVVSISVSGSVTNEDELCDEEDVLCDITGEDIGLSDATLPSCKKMPRSKLKILATKCRESLSIIQNATYLCQDETTLEHLSVLLNEASSYINNRLHKEEGLIPEPSKKRKRVQEQPMSAKKKKLDTKSENRLKLRKRKENRSSRYGKTTSRNISLEDQKREEQEEEMIIIDGHSTVPQSILECIAEMVSQMTKNEWEALIFKATKEAATSTDTISQIAVTLLEEYCEDDHIQTLKTISDNHCPKDMTNPQKFRMALLMLHKLVETKKFILKRNFEKERMEREAAEKACVEAIARMEGFNKSEPTSSGKIQILKFEFCLINASQQINI
ncbi:uncharacterized protein LOC134249268 [Saccostrea cucullata]|uniref:uncharacterized protein LOC134249268 n=1 Tax=Saccostrea cuccullata TaxID=36930 RepID=UPI002ED0BE91